MITERKREDNPDMNDLIKILEKHGVKVEKREPESDVDFVRDFKFELEGVIYRILWYHNESTLFIGEHFRAAFVKFKYIFFDNCYPIEGACLAFAYRKNEVRSIFDPPFDYEVFRIPLPVK